MCSTIPLWGFNLLLGSLDLFNFHSFCQAWVYHPDLVPSSSTWSTRTIPSPKPWPLLLPKGPCELGNAFLKPHQLPVARGGQDFAYILHLEHQGFGTLVRMQKPFKSCLEKLHECDRNWEGLVVSVSKLLLQSEWYDQVGEGEWILPSDVLTWFWFVS